MIKAFWIRGVMDAVNKRKLGALQRYCRCNIGENHKFFNKLVGIKAIARDNIFDKAVFTQNNFALRQIKIKGRAFCPLTQTALIGIIKRTHALID